MRLLVFGCGYLGERVATLWRGLGHEVAAITRSAERAAAWERRGWHTVVGNVTDPQTLAHLPEVDVCLHAIGFDRQAAPSKREVSVDGLRHVLEALRERCPRLLHISSSSVYGQDEGEWVDADSICQPHTESGQICLAAENLLEERADQFSLGAVVIRLSGIYGPQRLLTRIDQLRTGVPLGGRGDAWLNLIHVDDAAQAVVRIAQATSAHPVFNRYLLSDQQPVQRQQFYGTLAQLVGGPAPQFDAEIPTRTGNTGIGKRCCSLKVRNEFQLTLNFPTYETGLPDASHRS